MIQLIFIPCCLRLQYHLYKCMPELSSRNTNSDSGYGIQMADQSTSSSWDNKRKEKKSGAVPSNDPRVEQLIFAIQGMAGQIKSLQEGVHRPVGQPQGNVGGMQQPQQMQPMQPIQQLQQQQQQPLINH
eukprot:gnl/Chilomastix_caulleri/2934.p1 GENE.gnl/Chilomastix_caulleri/2934~~gnl/Chilomastix_caulleri/2934.p1  ORF type:complete len:129 (+),score=40.70 gnl/Chilomastix_caulleri/2934:165-551(+)